MSFQTLNLRSFQLSEATFPDPIAGCVLGTELFFTPENTFLREYFLRLIRNPDPESQFAQTVEKFKDIPDETLLRMLFANNYNALVYHSGQEVIGHVAFQTHEDKLHMFSIGVDAKARGTFAFIPIIIDLVEWGRSNPHISTVYLGGGGHKAMRRIIAALAPIAHEYGVQPEGEFGFRYIDKNIASE